MWTKLSLKMTFTTPLCGGVPRSDDIVKRWCELRAATPAAHEKLQRGLGPDNRMPQNLGAVAEEAVATIDPLDPADEMAKVWVGFSRDETGLFVRGANLRAHLKDCASVLGPRFKAGDFGGARQIKLFKAKLADAVYIAQDRLYLRDETQRPITEASGFRDATLSVMTALGPRTCLKRVDMCFPCTILATVQLLPGGEINRDHIVACLEYGKVHAFGQDRSLQYGRYDYELGE